MTENAPGLNTRADAIAQICNRIASNVGTWLRDEECVQLALACGTRMQEELVEFLFAPQVRRNVQEFGTENIAVTVEEWSKLFGWDCQPTRTASLGEVLREDLFQSALKRVQCALVRTVQEPAQAEVWKRSWSQASVYLATHMNEDDLLLEATLGNVVSADTRRLEDLRSTIDDEGAATLLLSSAIVSLSKTVT